MALPPVLVARFADRAELAPVVRAALETDIVYIRLEAPPPFGKHTMQLWVGPGLVAAVTAELVGSGRSGEYPMRVRPIDPAHVPELQALLEPRSRSSAAPAPRAEQAPHGDAAQEAAGAGAEDKTLTSRGASPPSVDEAPEVEAPVPGTTVFNPDAVLQEPPANTGSEDVTLPIRPQGDSASRRLDRGMQSSDGGAPSPPSGRSLASWNVRIAPTTRDPLCGERVGAGKYLLESVIGTGAIGIVFKASHSDLGRTVAIKVLNPRYRDDPELLTTFQREARAASLLEHPHVARVYDYGQEPDGLVYIVMEYLSGYTLGSVLEARHKLVVPRAIDIMMQTCAALAAAHDRGIVHRDVKPDNIVLVPAQDDEGEPVEIVKVCDFGIAALGAQSRTREAPSVATTEEGFTAGTPEYMAPEQAMSATVTCAADVYACGVVLYEMLVGKVPFSADKPYQVLQKHREEAPVPPSRIDPSIDPRLEAVVLRALDKTPGQRYQNAREMRVDLRKAL